MASPFIPTSLRVCLAFCVSLMPTGCSSDDSSTDTSSGGTGSGGAGASCAADNDCEACMMCALAGPCKSGLDACRASAECMTFSACVPETDDAALIAGCKADHPTGAGEYCAYVDCAVYDECAAVCEPAQVCPP